MKKLILILMTWFVFGLSASAYAEITDPDVEGRISDIHYLKSEIVVSNVLTGKNVGAREKRIRLKPGMIGSYKLMDYVKVKLSADHKRAVEIELVKH